MCFNSSVLTNNRFTTVYNLNQNLVLKINDAVDSSNQYTTLYSNQFSNTFVTVMESIACTSTLSDVLNTVDSEATISLESGTYNSFTINQRVNLVKKDEDGVVLFKNSAVSSISGLERINFEKSTVYSGFISTINNCYFNNSPVRLDITKTNIYNSGFINTNNPIYTTNHPFLINVHNITFEKITGYAVMMGSTSCNRNGMRIDVYNITVKDSTFTSVAYLGWGANLDHITVKNSKITNRFFIDYDKQQTSYTLSNIYLENVNFTGNNLNLFYSNRPVTIEHVTFKNVNLANNIVFRTLKSLKHVNLTNVNNTYYLVFNTPIVDDFNCTNFNGRVGIYSQSKSDLSNINFNNVNFTTSMADLVSSTLKNSEFKDFTGPIVLRDDNELSYVTFIDGVNNAMYENGTALYVLGEYNIIEHSTFRNLNASNGGAIYVIGQAISVLDSDFKYCNATGEGGAIYIKGTIGYYVDKETRNAFIGNRATTPIYYNIYDELALKGMDIVYVSLSHGREDGNGSIE
ncbi:MAG: hypothetical protein IJI98_05035, partial [Methanosphaera sp.]|nr:hypothetical protein [Methanosphaera sp.]